MYFAYQYTGESFVLFSDTHLVMLLLFILAVSSLFVFRKKLQSPKLRTPMRRTLIITLIICELSLNVWYVVTDAWNVTETLPFQLCTISLYLSIIMLITRSYKWFEVVFFIGIGGALQALLTPELYFDFPHFRYFQFFIAHIAIVLASLYMVFIEGYRPRFISIWKSWLTLNMIAFFVFFLNKWLDANYMFLAQKPVQTSLLDYLPEFPWYILYLEMIAIIIFFLLYLPFLYKKRN